MPVTMTIGRGLVPRPVQNPGSEDMPEISTDLLFLRDAYSTSCEATVVDVAAGDDGGDVSRLALNRTIFYPTGGGQPHDVGALSWPGGEAAVVDVRKQG